LAKIKIQNVISKPSPLSCITSGHKVEAINQFVYLGSHVYSSGYCMSEFLRRIGLASSVVSQLLKADAAKLQAFHMTNERQLHGIY